MQERQVASSEERVVKFLKCLLEHKSALGVAQSLCSVAPERAHQRLARGGRDGGQKADNG